MRHHVGMRLDLGDEAGRLHASDNLLAHDEAVEAVIGQGFLELRRARQVAQESLVALEIELGLDVEHADLRQVVAPSDLEVVEVVGRRDLDRASALLGVGISSATIGMRRPTSGRMAFLPTRCL